LYTLLFAVLIALFGSIVYIQTSHRLYSSVDDTLTQRAQRIIADSDADPGVSVQPDQSVLDEIAAPGVYVVIVNADGAIVASSSNLNGSVPFSSRRRPNTVGPNFETHETSNGERVRVLYDDLPSGNHLIVARSLHPTDAALDKIRVVLIGGGIGFLLIANLLAYLVAAPALRPIGRATASAAEIEATADFSRRISGGDQPGDVGELVRTLNDLIAKVESTLDAHRAFLADSSHELRRPLAVLRGNLEVLNSDAIPAAERREIIAETEAESRRMSQILSDLLMLSQVDARLILQLQSIDLGKLVQAVAERERQRFPDRVIRYEAPVAPVEIRADEQRVRQVLENLVENAARYSDTGKPIDLAVRRSGRFAVAEVRDQGPGMTPDESRHAFERFFRGSHSRRQHADGTGLGLAIVRHIAEAHGGGVAMTSSPTGTDVKVELPLTGLN
jgi:signal transduction histidine kinase